MPPHDSLLACPTFSTEKINAPECEQTHRLALFSSFSSPRTAPGEGAEPDIDATASALAAACAEGPRAPSRVADERVGRTARVHLVGQGAETGHIVDDALLADAIGGPADGQPTSAPFAAMETRRTYTRPWASSITEDCIVSYVA